MRAIVSWSIIVLATFPVISQNIVFLKNQSKSSLPINIIDSIKAYDTGQFKVFVSSREDPILVSADTSQYHVSLPDTLIIDYHESWVYSQNPHLDWINIEIQGTNVTINSFGKKPFICKVRGICNDGRLIIESDTTSTLVLDGVSLSSQKGSAIYLKGKQTTTIEINEGTVNNVADAHEYLISDETDKSNAGIYSRGTLVFVGLGELNVNGNYRHAISSSKSIEVNNGQINILNTFKDGIHCDKYYQSGGIVALNLFNPATKGIKAKEIIEINGGQIEGHAMGDLTITDGETTYCTFIKCDSTCIINDGEINLSHRGDGGRCISVDADLYITGAYLNLECHGNGGGYVTALNDSDYYTPKCITVDGRAFIQRGQVNLLSTGIGGKGLDCSDTIFVGRINDGFLSEDSLLIKIETRGNSVVENVLDDYLHGCPKAMKSDNAIEIYSGNLRIKTFGSGGEGIESKGSFRAYNATIIADCYDDGINTGDRCYIKGAHIYCSSLNNDGIDSNGKLSIHDGIVAAISEHFMNESFDTEGGRLYIYGGHVIGIGHNEVYVSGQSTVPYYSTKTKINDWGIWYGDNIRIHREQYLTVSNELSSVISLFHKSSFEDAFITVASTNFIKDELYQITDGMPPSNPSIICFDGQMLLDGIIDERESIYNFNPY